jgi:hypothetical protein
VLLTTGYAGRIVVLYTHGLHVRECMTTLHWSRPGKVQAQSVLIGRPKAVLCTVVASLPYTKVDADANVSVRGYRQWATPPQSLQDFLVLHVCPLLGLNVHLLGSSGVAEVQRTGGEASGWC